MGKGKGKSKNMIFGVQKQQLKHLSSKEYEILLELCHLSKNIYNVALYHIRQYYFTEKKYLSYESNYHLCKENENYKILNSNLAQQIMKICDRNFKSFFALIESAKKSGYQFKDIKLPRYLKKDGYFSLIFSDFCITNGFFTVPMSNAFKKQHGVIKIKVPSNLLDKKMKEVRIIPKQHARFFEIQYIYEMEASNETLDKQNVLAIDLGGDNLATCVTNYGSAFIVDGKKLKSMNVYANKVDSKLQSIKDKQHIFYHTKKEQTNWNKRNNKVNDYLRKTARYIMNYCISNNIGKMVIGYHATIQEKRDIGKGNCQSFVYLPLGNLREKLSYLCKRYQIEFVEQEESYTSKSDFLAGDILPVYNPFQKERYIFRGERIKRGLYKSSKGILLNADINGALNILRKSGEADINLVKKEYLSPLRIKVS